MNKTITYFNYCLPGNVPSMWFQLTSVKGSIDFQLRTRKPSEAAGVGN